MAAVQDPAKVEAGPRPSITGNGVHRSQHDLVEAAVAAAEAEARLPRKELFRRYLPAAIFSTLLSLALVMEGMDVGLINNFFAHPNYLQKFGWPDSEGKMHISTTWQSAIGAGNNVGSLIGLLLNGYLQSRFGSRRVYMGGMVAMGSAIFILFFSQNVEMLLAGNIICGIPWGMFQTLSTAYAAEICPAAMRGYLTAWVSMCWGAGSFLATGVLRGSLNLQGDAGWRLPYGLQWVWVPPLLLVGFFAPESPWYLIRRGKVDQAEKSLRRLARKGHYTEESMAETIALMKHTNEMERLEAANASYKDCFNGENKRRTLIVCMAWVVQMFNGQSITQYAALMLKAVGMSTDDAFNYNMGIQSVNILATGIAIALMGKVGRRTFYLFGSGGIGACMLVIGILGFATPKEVHAVPVAAFLIIVQCVFKVSLGPTTYVIVGEMSSSRVRAQTIVLGRGLYVCCGFIVQQINPRMLNSDSTAWNWGAKTGMFYFGFCFLWVLWSFFFLPETKERTFAEIDYLFKKKTPARKFATTPVDLFEFAAPSDKSADTFGLDEQVEEITVGENKRTTS
ncbi:alpha-glucosides permease MPH2/3 [Emericellopsis atlantica]|uniref:Alpha-glucosides permease MPH2/3 n=1 Tax=Emericellopsis atlantica TaxID=2614577 RepID=A0A9P7ZDH4_9HYPO|nr:alpha-glucosides permease MPH2/3 [Emericellopsis atlantica]KAG9249453.1 alpha-glucosides permease MPH2/3 [Emericellopsis atlantica]